MSPSSPSPATLAFAAKEISLATSKLKIVLGSLFDKTSGCAILPKSSFAKNNTKCNRSMPLNNPILRNGLLRVVVRLPSYVRSSVMMTMERSIPAAGVLQWSLQRPFVTVTKTSSSSKDTSLFDHHGSGNGSGSSSGSGSSNHQVDDGEKNGHNQNNVLALVDQDNHVITITPSAVRQIDYLAKRKNPSHPSDMFLRVYVDAGGCSGFQYKFEMDQDSQHDTDKQDDGVMLGIDPEEDVVITCRLSSQGDKDGGQTLHIVSPHEDNQICVRVVIDRASLDLLHGCKVDFVTEMIRSSFAIVDNPQSESACGCGSSFAVKNFGANPALD